MASSGSGRTPMEGYKSKGLARGSTKDLDLREVGQVKEKHFAEGPAE